MPGKPVPDGNSPTVKEDKSSTAPKKFFYIFSALLFVVVIYYYSEIEREVLLLEKVKWYWLAGAIVIQLLTYLSNALVYQILMQGYNIRPLPGLPELYRISVISLFFNQTVPSANISGNTFIFNYLHKRKINGSAIFSVLLIELVVFYAAMALFCLCFLATALFFFIPHVLSGVLSAGLVIYVLFISAILLITKKRSIEFVLRRLAKVKLLKTHILPFLNRLEHSEKATHEIALLPFICSHTKLVALAVSGQLLAIILDAVTIVFLFYGLGRSIPLFTALLVLVGTRVVAVLPVSPGSLIIFESSMVLLLKSMGVSLSMSVMVTLLFRLLSFWLPMPAGFLLYRKWVHHSVKENGQ